MHNIEVKKSLSAEFSKKDCPRRPLKETEMKPGQTRQIERAKQEWEVTVDSLPQLVCLLDQQKRIIRANRTLERWQLGQVVQVKGQNVHDFLHANCTISACYLTSFLNRSWGKLVEGQSAELETKDNVLNRYLNLQLQPLPTQTVEKNLGTTSHAVLILDDITEQQQTEAALRQSALELKARNEELDAFAHTVAHNLNGSLLPIIGNAEILQVTHKTIPAETLVRNLDNIAQAGQKMSRIIDELMLLAGVRKMDVELKPLDMGAIVAEVEQRLTYMIKEYQAELILPDAWPVAWGYGPWVEEVWANYLNNAIKYGGRPPCVEMGATLLEERDGLIRFWVKDNGQGLGQKEQAILFTPFTQLNQAQIDGHGLGLSIVRRIVEKLGGQVGVESEGVTGQGSVFSFTLPKA